MGKEIIHSNGLDVYKRQQLLTPTKINDKILSQVLNHIRVSEHLRYIELESFGSEHWEISFGQKDPKQSLQVEELSIENENLAVLSWQAGLPCPDPVSYTHLGIISTRASSIDIKPKFISSFPFGGQKARCLSASLIGFQRRG